ncbi:glutathione S-transferase N-terminal domain-containing protein [Xenophilus arseniciresistens]|uniref:Glutathione S-transferase N-terminal domain-containing protein n=1 Tax=Xenophilus arseniciresistens TaxID=1283306 RepID=A0AAE3T0H2_9BURK|nr:glutathione S-transferase N-terminal domain-containing protein [Xenophilus arseniciresistens]MDA7417605.1 glutathione S-transferase N-terminal domain-containing protein [Xenophilus arseniciresistens]
MAQESDSPPGLNGRPVLYSFRRCPYAMRARLALLASGQACTLREVVLRDKPAALLAASPKGTVPVLQLADGVVIDQSLDIMRWALARQDPLGWLVGDGEAMQALIAQCDGPFKQALDAYKYPERHPQWAPGAARDAIAAQAAALDARLQSQAFLFGPQARLADVAWMPFVRQAAQVDAAWFGAQPWPRLQAWLQQWVQSPLFERAMRKLPPWQPGQPDEVFACAS